MIIKDERVFVNFIVEDFEPFFYDGRVLESFGAKATIDMDLFRLKPSTKVHSKPFIKNLVQNVSKFQV